MFLLLNLQIRQGLISWYQLGGSKTKFEPISFAPIDLFKNFIRNEEKSLEAAYGKKKTNYREMGIA